MAILRPGSLIQYIPFYPGNGTNLLRYGTEFTEVKWIKRNEIGLFVKASPDLASRAICLFGEELFTVPIASIKTYTEE
jgi:hypothetical protein